MLAQQPGLIHQVNGGIGCGKTYMKAILLQSMMQFLHIEMTLYTQSLADDAGALLSAPLAPFPQKRIKLPCTYLKRIFHYYKLLSILKANASPTALQR